jgi:hypothetical protein
MPIENIHYPLTNNVNHIINCYSQLSWKAVTTRLPRITCRLPKSGKRRLSLPKRSGMMQKTNTPQSPHSFPSSCKSKEIRFPVLSTSCVVVMNVRSSRPYVPGESAGKMKTRMVWIWWYGSRQGALLENECRAVETSDEYASDGLVSCSLPSRARGSRT